MKTRIIRNCCSKDYLAMMKMYAESSSNWDYRWPLMDPPLPIEVRFPKIRLIENKPVPEEGVLAGMAMGLLIQINDACGGELLEDEIISCQIAMKDRHRRDNHHTDYNDEHNVYKILGMLNPYWHESWAGGFMHEDITYQISPGENLG
jgi:hypothetical protein